MSVLTVAFPATVAVAILALPEIDKLAAERLLVIWALLADSTDPAVSVDAKVPLDWETIDLVANIPPVVCIAADHTEFVNVQSFVAVFTMDALLLICPVAVRLATDVLPAIVRADPVIACRALVPLTVRLFPTVELFSITLLFACMVFAAYIPPNV